MADPNFACISQEVELLKIQGNKHYVDGQYDAAYYTFSEALKQDSANAVLYSNRAAVCLAQKEYLDAAWDSQRAVILDPTYLKAWRRLGIAAQALGIWGTCIYAWTKALDCLTHAETTVTPAEQAMKSELEEGLKKSQDARSANEMLPPFRALNDPRVQAAGGGTPWDRANTILSRKIDAKRISSAFVIYRAYGTLAEGLHLMDQYELRLTDRYLQERSRTKAIVPISNGILDDERSFNCINDPHFQEKAERQCALESQVLVGWADDGTLQTLKDQVLERVNTIGWVENVRGPASVTVRIWVFKAFLASELGGDRTFAHESYSNAIDFLEWGRENWPESPNVSAIFRRSFIRGIKKLKLLNMHKAISADADAPFSTEQLVALARGLIEDVDSDPPPQDQTTPLWRNVTYASYWCYAKGHALGILGWYYTQKGLSFPSETEGRQTNLRKGAEFYENAALSFPDDDENHANFLRMSLKNLFKANAPLKETLPLCRLTRRAITRALEIWSSSAIAQPLRDFREGLAEFEREYLDCLINGKATMDTVAHLT